MDMATARKMLSATQEQGYSRISITSPFMFHGGERVKFIALVTPKSGNWAVMDGTAVRSEWVGGNMGYMLHHVMMDNGQMVKTTRGDITYKIVPVVEMDHDGTMDITIKDSTVQDDVSWSVEPIIENGRAGLRMVSEYWDGVRVNVEYFTPERWDMWVMDDGDEWWSVKSENGFGGARTRTLSSVLALGMQNGAECEADRDTEDYYGDMYEDSGYDYPEYFEGPDPDLMNEW